MKRVPLIFLAFFMAFVSTGFAKKKERKVAHVLVPFIPIFEERRPESNIVVQAHRGERYIIRREGEYWVEVYVPDKKTTGWLEIGLGEPKIEILTEEDKSYIIMQFVYLGLFLFLVALVIYLIRYYNEVKRKKALEKIQGQ